MRDANTARYLALLSTLALAACASARPPPPPSPCELVVGTATSVGRATAARRADIDFRNQVPDSRGDLVSAGYRRTRVFARRTECSPYRWFGAQTGLTTCTVSARVCGR
jgi:hypothetical protein